MGLIISKVREASLAMGVALLTKQPRQIVTAFQAPRPVLHYSALRASAMVAACWAKVSGNKKPWVPSFFTGCVLQSLQPGEPVEAHPLHQLVHLCSAQLQVRPRPQQECCYIVVSVALPP